MRFICGTQDIHKALEREVARFHGMEDAILFPSCFDANAGIFEALLGKDDALISDALNHASIIDGIRLSKAQRQLYKHCDMADLEEKLKVRWWGGGESSSAAYHTVVSRARPGDPGLGGSPRAHDRDGRRLLHGRRRRAPQGWVKGWLKGG